VASSVLITACALTKYFGVSLIVLLPVYSLVKQRRFGAWVFYLLIPVAGLNLYQVWTKALYGRGLLWDAAQYARSPEHVDQASRFICGLVGLSFLGGCALPILLFTPFLWNRLYLFTIGFAGALAGFAVGMQWLHPLIHNLEQHWLSVGIQFALYVTGGISVLALTIADYKKRRDAESALLGLWVLGTFLFAAFLNWTVNARSLLPLIPAAAILLARRLDELRASPFWSMKKLAIPIVVSAIISVFIAWGDTAFANSGRNFAHFIQRRTQNQAGNIFFEGHWGFQYYMQLFGAHPVEYDKFSFRTGDLLVIPENTTSTFLIPPQFIGHQHILQVDPHVHSATMALGGGFYSSVWGPLPFSFGLVPPESYLVINLKQPSDTDK
jgi:hypothetical protein